MVRNSVIGIPTNNSTFFLQIWIQCIHYTNKYSKSTIEIRVKSEIYSKLTTKAPYRSH